MSYLQQIDALLHRLFVATLRHESLLTLRDTQILEAQRKHAAEIAKSAAEAASLKTQIEKLYLDHRAELEPEGKKSLQLASGIVGMRAPSHPALIPLSDKWSWKKIAAKVKRVWKKQYFHAPKEPALDKVKLKRELTPEQLQELGLRLDTAESFFLELNRLSAADPLPVEAPALKAA